MLLNIFLYSLDNLPVTFFIFLVIGKHLFYLFFPEYLLYLFNLLLRMLNGILFPLPVLQPLHRFLYGFFNNRLILRFYHIAAGLDFIGTVYIIKFLKGG